MNTGLTVYRRSELEDEDFEMSDEEFDFWSRVEMRLGGLFEYPTPCWPWIGSKSYGNYKGEGAHRVAYALTYGVFHPAMCVLHHCDNPRCVRPDHLFLGTKKDNSQDMARKGRARGWNTDKRICKNGHVLEGDNIKLVRGGRRCWPCFLEWQRKYRARNAS